MHNKCIWYTSPCIEAEVTLSFGRLNGNTLSWYIVTNKTLGLFHTKFISGSANGFVYCNDELEAVEGESLIIDQFLSDHWVTFRL